MSNQKVVVLTSQSLVPHYPFRTTCPYCNADVVTAVRKETGVLTWIACVGCVLFGCWLGCCLIPFCVDPLKDSEHICPNCSRMIAKRQQMNC